jgi:hypothetical protein
MQAGLGHFTKLDIEVESKYVRTLLLMLCNIDGLDRRAARQWTDIKYISGAGGMPL